MMKILFRFLVTHTFVTVVYACVHPNITINFKQQCNRYFSALYTHQNYFILTRLLTIIGKSQTTKTEKNLKKMYLMCVYCINIKFFV